MYYFLGICLLFAFLLALNFLVSLMALVIWRIIEKTAQNWTARSRTQVIFSLRIIPLIVALVLVCAFLSPAYLLFEPHSADETVTPKLAILTLLSLIGITTASLRVFGTWWRTHRLVKNWIKLSEPILIKNFKFPVYRIRHPFPVIAIVGTFRVKMFVAEQIFDSLDENELRAAIAHECGHLETNDNFKRTLLRICRDLLVFPMGKTLDRAWAENAESAADEYAAQIGGDSMALNLAAALVKVARIVPPNTSPAMPFGAFFIEENAIDITWRVKRLIKLAENLNSLKESSKFNLQLALATGSVIIFGIIVYLSTNHYFLFQVHTILEEFVAILQ